jgi:hypothetical protein
MIDPDDVRDWYDEEEEREEREYDELDLAPGEGYDALSELGDYDEDGAEIDDGGDF